MSKYGNNLSEETLKMFSILDQYEEGKLNLFEASKKLAAEHSIGSSYAIKILKQMERENIIMFPDGNVCTLPIKKGGKGVKEPR